MLVCIDRKACKDGNMSWIAVGEPRAALSQFDRTLRQGEIINQSRRRLECQLNILEVVCIPVASTIGKQTINISVVDHESRI